MTHTRFSHVAKAEAGLKTQELARPYPLLSTSNALQTGSAVPASSAYHPAETSEDTLLPMSDRALSEGM